MKDMLRAGDPCPGCEKPIERAEGVFYHYALGLHPGLLCRTCKRCWDDPDNSFIDTVGKWAKEQWNGQARTQEEKEPAPDSRRPDQGDGCRGE